MYFQPSLSRFFFQIPRKDHISTALSPIDSKKECLLELQRTQIRIMRFTRDFPPVIPMGSIQLCAGREMPNTFVSGFLT